MAMGMMTEYYHFIFTTLVKYLAVHTPCTPAGGGGMGGGSWSGRVGWVSDPGVKHKERGDLGPCQEERRGQG